MKFVGYIPFGYPTIQESIKIVEIYCESGCKAIEASFPLLNPIGESEMIVEYMKKALEKCSNYDMYLNGIKEIREKHKDLEINLLMVN